MTRIPRIVCVAWQNGSQSFLSVHSSVILEKLIFLQPPSSPWLSYRSSLSTSIESGTRADLFRSQCCSLTLSNRLANVMHIWNHLERHSIESLRSCYAARSPRSTATKAYVANEAIVKRNSHISFRSHGVPLEF